MIPLNDERNISPIDTYNLTARQSKIQPHNCASRFPLNFFYFDMRHSLFHINIYFRLVLLFFCLHFHCLVIVTAVEAKKWCCLLWVSECMLHIMKMKCKSMVNDAEKSESSKSRLNLSFVARRTIGSHSTEEHIFEEEIYWMISQMAWRNELNGYSTSLFCVIRWLYWPDCSYAAIRK